jgi:hypothetical protein
VCVCVGVLIVCSPWEQNGPGVAPTIVDTDSNGKKI